MLDLHCHILPALDDGAASLDEALTMARFCVKDGITHITATPHCNRQYQLFRKEILPLVAQFNEKLVSAAVPLTILPGSEIRAVTTQQYIRDFESGVFCHLGDSRSFTLLEFDWKGELYLPDAPELIRWLRDRGMTPIVAHPERHGYFTQEPERLQKLVDAGAWLQITADSLLGNHGAAPKAAAEKLLPMYQDVVMASDAHNLRRCSGLSTGYAWVRDKFGEHREQDLRERSARVLSAIAQA